MVVSGWRCATGTGWGTLDAIVGAGDFDEDGAPDILARAARNGDLRLCPTSGSEFGLFD